VGLHGITLNYKPQAFYAIFRLVDKLGVMKGEKVESTNVMDIMVKSDLIKLVFLHPDNNSYPLNSILLGGLDLNIKLYSDQIPVIITLKDLEVSDNT